MGIYNDISRTIIADVHKGLSLTASLADRKRALLKACPFPQSGWPYKCWRKARKSYLAPYHPRNEIDNPPGPLFAKTEDA